MHDIFQGERSQSAAVRRAEEWLWHSFVMLPGDVMRLL